MINAACNSVLQRGTHYDKNNIIVILPLEIILRQCLYPVKDLCMTVFISGKVKKEFRLTYIYSKIGELLLFLFYYINSLVYFRGIKKLHFK